MNAAILDKLICPVTRHDKLSYRILKGDEQDIEDAIVWNTATGQWYFVEGRLLDLLPPEFSYPEDRRRFFDQYKDTFNACGLSLEKENDGSTHEGSERTQSVLEQQEHFDQYSGSETQTYTEYENSPFWKAADAITFERWKQVLEASNPSGKLLVDIGSAQGRSCQYFSNAPLDIVGLDISKECLRQAIDRYPAGKSRAHYHFIATDCSRFPFQDASVDYVLIYGVLHHLPDPSESCAEIIRTLRPGGLYFGSENHKSILRFLFDLLMILKPQWYEKAGAEPLLSRKDLHSWLSDEHMHKDWKYSIYVPPHLINALGNHYGNAFLRLTDKFFSTCPLFDKAAGLITLVGTKR